MTLYAGTYYEETTGRGIMEVTRYSDNTYSVEVTWPSAAIGITAAVTIAAVIFLGYQYFKRFFDEFTLFAVLADVTFIEYLAPVIVGSGLPLWVAFGIIQVIYIAVRDWNDENSGIKGFIDLWNGNG